MLRIRRCHAAGYAPTAKCLHPGSASGQWTRLAGYVVGLPATRGALVTAPRVWPGTWWTQTSTVTPRQNATWSRISAAASLGAG